MSELELKFHVPDAVLVTLRDALLLHGAVPLRLQAHYFDTADGLLAQHRIALRLRLEGTQWLQTLKAAGDGIAHRLEHEVPVGSLPGAADTVPALDIRRHDGSDAGRALAAVLAKAPRGDGAALVERHGTDVLRLHCLLQDAAGTRIEAALDIGSSSAGGRVANIAELELEHKGGPLPGVFDLARAWVLHGGLWLSSLSKAAQGERLLRGDAEPPALRATAPRLPAQPDGRVLLQALLQSALEQVIGNAGTVADGAVSADAIHQLRVGLRRLRTVLREMAPLAVPASPQLAASPGTSTATVPALPPAARTTPVGGIAPEWEPVLAATFGTLGQVRDQDAAAAAVRPVLVAADAPLLAWHAAEAPDPVAAVRHPQFQATLVDILALAHAAPDAVARTPPSAAQTRKLLTARLRKLHRQLVADGRRFRDLPLEAQHTVRKRLKRLRYLADMTAALWPDKPLRRYLKRLSVAQEALGAHNDVAVAAAAFRDDAAHHAEAWFAAGYLQARLTVTAAAGHAALRKVVAAAPFWT